MTAANVTAIEPQAPRDQKAEPKPAPKGTPIGVGAKAANDEVYVQGKPAPGGTAVGIDPNAKAANDEVYEELTKHHTKPKRTLGLKLFDIGLYPLLSNFAVFAASVGFTFLTHRGGDLRRVVGKNGAEELQHVYGRVGKWFAARGVWLEKQFRQKLNMDEKQAETWRIVFFSFADGTLFAPLVKLFEDRREKIAHWIDDKLGTKSEDLRAYDAEPKQSWASVLTGRFLTAGAVIAVALGFEKKWFKSSKSLNDILFRDKSAEHGAYLMAKPGIRDRFFSFLKKITGTEGDAKILARDDEGGLIEIAEQTVFTVNPGKNDAVVIPSSPNLAKYSEKEHGGTAAATLARMTYFEFAYTSLCTAGLYFISRAVAPFFDGHGKKDQAKPPKLSTAPSNISNADVVSANDANYKQDISPKQEAPSGKVSAVVPSDKVVGLTGVQVVG